MNGGVVERFGFFIIFWKWLGSKEFIIGILVGKNKTVPGVIFIAPDQGEMRVVAGILITEVTEREIKLRHEGSTMILSFGTMFVREGPKSGLGRAAVEASRRRH